MTALERSEQSQAEAVIAGLTDLKEGDLVKHKGGQYAMVINPTVTRCGYVFASWLSCVHRSKTEHRRGFICKQCDPLDVANQALRLFHAFGLPASLRQFSVPTYFKAANVRLWERQ